jgi:hypothetical protein
MRRGVYTLHIYRIDTDTNVRENSWSLKTGLMGLWEIIKIQAPALVHCCGKIGLKSRPSI